MCNEELKSDAASSAPLGRRVLFTIVSLLAAAAIWLPSLHFFFRPDLKDYLIAEGTSPKARALAARHLKLSQPPAVVE